MAVTLANNHRNGAVASVGVARVHVVATSKILCSQKKTHTHTHRIRTKEMRIRQRCAQFCTVFNGVEVWEREREGGEFLWVCEECHVWGFRWGLFSMCECECAGQLRLHMVNALKSHFSVFFPRFFWRGVNIERAGKYEQRPSPHPLMLPQKRGRIIKHLNDFKRNYVGTST